MVGFAPKLVPRQISTSGIRTLRSRNLILEKENAKIRADAINKANKKIEKNLEKLVGVRVWDNKVKVSGTIKSVKFDNKINAKPDSMGFVNVGEVNKFSAVIQWHSGKKQVVTGPYLFGDEPIFLDK